jgi:cytochrome c oxidase subunit III
MFYTLALAFMFILLQLFEYYSSSFSINDNSFGTVFYSLTGLHGLHVFFGTLFILLNIIFTRSTTSVVSMDISIIYWHFVDFIWILLLCIVYY